MLLGYTLPRTPLGLAAITPPPPWHYSSDIVGIEYWADPSLTAALLPPGLSVDPETNGHSALLFLDWQFTAQNEELLDPSRFQYREAFVLIDAMRRDTPVSFCPFIYVDNDAALARGWAQGFPKRLGSIFQTRSFAAPSAAAAPVARGSRFAGSLSTHGVRLAEAIVTLQQPEPDIRKIFSRPTVNLRYFPRLEAQEQHRPAVNELVLSLTDDLKIVDLWTGDGEIRMPAVAGEELSMLAPVRMGRGFRCSMSYSVTDLKILERFDQPSAF
ncbi:acetoacetate decarboxylase family protein [Variovorax saccharolyticus]|uniref:acetoacetate decarboxylase family protein n=1 Tax=Variovorax saccharolyticus TaxID=3053516 RepID=UPI002576BC52|nr:acetoacetate decarboxylase family protein [Variovorax sp. J22R187]MDM0022800.1 acetoacetate decarboxylase family protein [Variovorax sp. J22R187]